jgi:hypothetical protein
MSHDMAARIGKNVATFNRPKTSRFRARAQELESVREANVSF